MKMAYTGRHIEGTRAKHRNDLQIFGAVLDEHDSAAQGFSQRRIDHDFRRRLWLSGLSDGVGRRQNGCRQDKAYECLGHVCFTLSELTRTDDVID
jgi:hypothetical protein